MTKSEICQLLPHSGNMCLLDKIISWDQETLVAETMSHIDPQNPLRKQDSVNSIHGIEYAAQAMAVHSILIKQQADTISEQPEKGAKGYLATIKNVQILADSLLPEKIIENIALKVSVSLKMSDNCGFTYQFEISTPYTKLLSGTITIFLL